MSHKSDFKPFDIKCYSKLEERFFNIFEPQLINEICQNGKLRLYQEDETLIDIGTIITDIPLLLQGSVKILTEDEDGNELLLYYLEFGETCAVTLNCCTRKTKSTIKAITETPTEILFIPIERLEEWMVKFKSWRVFILNSYNDRLNEMVSAIDNIVFNSLEDRLIKYLRDKAMIQQSGLVNVSHQEIANDLHSSRVAISRLMKSLEHKNIIKQKRNKILFLEFAGTDDL